MKQAANFRITPERMTNSRSRPFEEFVALMAQRTDRTFVTGLLCIAWYTVGRIVERVTRRLGGDPLARLHGLRHIGIDALSYEKHHKYVTVVTDHDRGCVVWVAPAATLPR